jgi:ribosome biogenesis protein UTP30
MSPLPPQHTAAVPLETIDRAVGALLKWLRHHPPPASDNFIYLILSLRSTPHNGRYLSFRLPLPHPLFSSICIFTNNPQVESQILNPSPSILPLSDLRSLYSSRESLSSLSNSFDLFLADRKIASRLPSLLGEVFYSKKKKRRSKETVQVNLANPAWPDKARQILSSTRLEMEGGHCKGVRVGRVSMERKEVVENVVAAVEAAVKCIPRKWDNIRSIHIKSNESIALPIYKESEEEDQDGEVVLEEDKGSKKRKGLVEKSLGGDLKNVKRAKR